VGDANSTSLTMSYPAAEETMHRVYSILFKVEDSVLTNI
jgi:hypothetical protein